MPDYVAFLRGINVGGHNKVSMAELRALLSGLGHTKVSTLLQSGNALFTAQDKNADRVAAAIEEQIAVRLRLEVRVVVRTRDALARAVVANPLAEALSQPAQLHMGFLSAQPSVEGLAELGPSKFPNEDVRLGDGVLYIWYRNGVGRSKLTNDVLERRLGVSVTLRNWNTVTKLLALA